MVETSSAHLRKNLCEWSRDSGKNLSIEEGGNLSIDEVGKVGNTVWGTEDLGLLRITGCH